MDVDGYALCMSLAISSVESFLVLMFKFLSRTGEERVLRRKLFKFSRKTFHLKTFDPKISINFDAFSSQHIAVLS